MVTEIRIRDEETVGIEGVTGLVYVEGTVDSATIVLTGMNEVLADHDEWLQVSLEGLEQWEADHGLAQDDAV